MPAKLHKALLRTAKKKGFAGKKKARYVYGALANAKKKSAY